MAVEAYIFGVLILASFLQTVTGFGYAIITAPLLALVLDAKETVMLVMITGFIIRLLLIRATKNEGSFREILPLITASTLGAIPGAYLMSIISSDGLKIFIGMVLLLAAASLWKNCTFPIKHVKITESVVGALSGFLATTTSINGPPVILYYLNAKAEEHRDVFRANLTRYFLLVNIVSIVISYVAGTLKIGELWVHTLLSIPASYIGFYWGERVFHRIDADTFKKASLLMVFISSVAIISSVLIKKL